MQNKQLENDSKQLLKSLGKFFIALGTSLENEYDALCNTINPMLLDDEEKEIKKPSKKIPKMKSKKKVATDEVTMDELRKLCMDICTHNEGLRSKVRKLILDVTGDSKLHAKNKAVFPELKDKLIALKGDENEDF